jgi:hypothetical protein
LKRSFRFNALSLSAKPRFLPTGFEKGGARTDEMVAAKKALCIRRTKIVSRKEYVKEYMVDLTLRIWYAVTTTDLLSSLQQKTLYTFE